MAGAGENRPPGARTVTAMNSPKSAPWTRFVALLRGINVGGHKPVSMSDLRDFMTALGLGDVRSLLQSGNLLFSRGRCPAADLEVLLEAEAQKRLGLACDFFVRSGREWDELVADNPFPDEAARDPGHLVAVCLKDAPPEEVVGALRKAIAGKEAVAAVGRILYVVYPEGIGRSKLTHALIEKKLATRGTGRNWNTVLKLAAACGESQ